MCFIGLVRQRMPILMFCVVTLLTMVVVSSVGAQEGKPMEPLLQILIKKGILTPQEAAEVQEEAARLEKQREKRIVEEVASKGASVSSALKGLKVGVLGYADYSAGERALPHDRQESFNRFSLTRGYLTIKKRINPWLGARITTDIHRDDTGDYKIRLKYLYGEIRPRDEGPLTNMKMEIGQGHNPWLDFEEHINPYRCQGTMAIERAGVFNSADLGVSIRGNIAGKLANASAKTGNHHYDGRYGSWHVGVYNGSGYHAQEVNGNKAVEGRFTLRPMPDVLPGLQLSYFGVYGEGNNGAADNPDYRVNLGMLSYEHPMGILTAQYFKTKGNAAGTWVNTRGNALNTEGYSFFGRIRLSFITPDLALLGRYDHFDQDEDNDLARDTAYDLYMAGLSYDLFKGNMLLLTYESIDFERDAGQLHKLPVPDNRLGDQEKVQVVYQIKF